MSGDTCATEQVTLQENDIVRNAQGVIIGHLVRDLNELCGRHNKSGYKQGYRAGQLDEREACAKVCETTPWSSNIDWWKQATKREVSERSALECAAAIRARGQL
jgi:hypothetical protein